MRRLLPLLMLCLVACGGSSGGTAKPNAAAQRGKELYGSLGCTGCHSVDGSSRVGPTWKGLYGATVTLDDGTTVTADDAYLRESILQPSAKTVKNFPKGVMESVIRPDSVKPADVDALIAYIESLK